MRLPGVIVNNSPAHTGKYIGSPSITVLSNGTILVSHDYFGPGTSYKTNAETLIFSSDDGGKSWKQISKIQPLFWGKLFTVNNQLFTIGTRHEYGDILIYRSDDGGRTWTNPSSAKTGLIKTGTYHCAPCKIFIHNGKIWRAFEKFTGGKWGNFNSFVISASIDSDLLNANSWSFSNELPKQKDFEWLEGNVLLSPRGELLNILRVNINTEGTDQAAIIHISPDGKNLFFNLQSDLINMPGGGSKFTIHFNENFNRYFAIVNKQTNPKAYRNNLVLISSENLKDWIIEKQIFFHKDEKKHGWQYVDWLFDSSNNIIFVSRTSADDAFGGAHRAHDANFLTFHKVSVR